MAFVDFAALKQRVAIENIVPLLGLEMKETRGQFRGPCPACRTGGRRALVVTPAKSAFYCFAGHTGGDVIALVAHIHDCSMQQAAQFLSQNGGEGREAGDAVDGFASSTVPEARGKGDARSLQPLTYLQADHAAVKTLGVLPETCSNFGAGYAPKGIMRGRFAVPIHDQHGVLIAYCGQAINGESPTLLFPKGFDPIQQIFNAQRIENGEDIELILARDPLEVLLAWQNGISNAISFLTETAQPQQLQLLASLMHAVKCDHLHIA